MQPFSQDFEVISKKKERSSVFHILISQCHFGGPSAGPPEANGPHDGPRGHCPPLPPLSLALMVQNCKISCFSINVSQLSDS